MIETNAQVGIVGSGAMGAGIAQIAATAGHGVVVYDSSKTSLDKSCARLQSILQKLESKEKIESAEKVFSRITFTEKLEDLSSAKLVIEAIVERLEIKQSVFQKIEKIVSEEAILATNTSSLSVTSIAAACQKPERVLGLHFFNPPPLMALVEVIPAIQTDTETFAIGFELMKKWGKTPVKAKDTPGFIVNRLARPFYGEALRIYEEGLADMATIDWAMTELGGFKMGPFTLMDYIGHDVNYVVTETVFTSFFFDPRYKPAFTQKRLLEAGWLGKKTGRGFYNYAEQAIQTEPKKDIILGQKIVDRIVAMLINEAVDAQYLGIASAQDLDTAMLKGVNYPKGLLAWADEIGKDKVCATLDTLYNDYHEDRYRASVGFRK